MAPRRLGVVSIALTALVWPDPGSSHAGAFEPGSSGTIDLTRAVVVLPDESARLDPPFAKAVAMLVEDVEARAGVRWEVKARDFGGRGPFVAIGLRSSAKSWAGPFAPAFAGDDPRHAAAEGFRIETVTDVADRPGGVAIAGNDARGVLFGVGRLLRELRTDRGRVVVPSSFRLTTAPKVALRGHQLGYRPKTNSYDAWDLPQWERYIRDLAAFGTNAFELLPPRTDDDADSPHFPRPPLEMMAGMSRLLDAYGLDVWVWYPAMDADYANPETIRKELKEWSVVFKAVPRIDAVFVPGGDPGHTHPGVLLDFLARATEQLHAAHPKGQMWVSPQGFNGAWYDEFIELLKKEPNWLSGVVHGPQVRVTLEQLRHDVPSRYPIRSYPDITHSRQCQHPVPDWDLAFAVTEGREAINPRPVAQAQILRASLPNMLGFLTYSEGCNDDVNKFVWSALGWDPEADVVDVLRQYGRFFIGDREAEPFAQALLALERNWSGPLLTNAGVETTLRQFQDLERASSPRVRQNWRFQQALYRAHYDAYLRDRLIDETALEARAMETLRQAPALGSALAMSRASAILDRSRTEPVSADRRTRVFSLAEALFQSVKMQLSVERYGAIAAERGANLDTIDTPLNNRVWLEGQFQAVRGLPTEIERLRALDALVNRTDPGPGGFYDDLGDPGRQPHLVPGDGFAADPALARSAFVGFALRPDWPTAWRHYAQSFYDGPLRMRYEGLDPHGRYRLRFTYSGDSPRARMRLEAEGTEVHGWLTKPNPVAPVEYPVPPAAVADGRLELTWTQEPGRGGNGRGCQVAEVWLIREAR
jgi:hypothetical protein